MVTFFVDLLRIVLLHGGTDVKRGGVVNAVPVACHSVVCIVINIVK